MKINRYVIVLTLTMVTVLLLSCSAGKKDPLKNTKKFVKESHISLYKNGAFNVPNTSIYLIPKGPEALDLAMELAGLRARDSFLLSLKRAAESVYIVKEGAAFSWKTAAGIHRFTGEQSDKIRKKSKEKRILLIQRSAKTAEDISVSSWAFSKNC